jgi:hypothetical protein
LATLAIEKWALGVFEKETIDGKHRREFQVGVKQGF